jgi:alkyldihydroxyacetonephosphate synthase
MKRWNGWGDESHRHQLPEGAAEFLRERVGVAEPPPAVGINDVLKQVPESRLPEHPLVTTEAAERLRHARGQSFPDWVATRSGQIGLYPDGVAHPTEDDEVRALLRYAREVGARVIPYGGGTSVVGHINPVPGDTPVLTVDMGRMNRLLDFDALSQLATFGAGVSGPDLEAHLRARGYTLGHYPQSWEYSTLGGWIATRSSGQQSLRYGRIEKMFAGGTVIMPDDELHLPSFPASAAGPDLRELVLGSEGRLGIITRATVRVSPLPEYEAFRAVFFPDFESGMDAVRQIAQAEVPLSMMRLSTAVETETNLRLAGKPGLIRAVERLLAFGGATEGKAMFLYGASGDRKRSKAAFKAAAAIAKRGGGVSMGIGSRFGATWAKQRFRTPYLRNTLWEIGYGVDTVETATTWNNVVPMLRAMEAALNEAVASFDERIHVFTHLSHMYPTGSSIYVSCIFRLSGDPETDLARWQALKTAVSEALVANGGTISHQHGVGTDHLPYLEAEKGEAGIRMIDALLTHADPTGMMNPGKLTR